MTLPSRPESAPVPIPIQERLAQLEAELKQVRERVQELEATNQDLENETVRRGVKLSCARIALSRAKIAFDETTRHRQEMVQDVAHDLRTPLTSIKGAAQNMLDGVAGPLGTDAREYTEIIREHADRLIGAVNWLLEAMRATTQPVELEATELDVGELCASVVHSLQPIAQKRSIALELDGCEAVAEVDGEKVRQVLENLIGNALKFTEAGGRVGVAAEADADSVRIRIRDTGVGIAEDELGRIFERYYRRNRAPGSSGLGLVISREVVRLHGGEICVQSEPGKGSEFTVRLPRNPDTPWTPNCD